MSHDPIPVSAVEVTAANDEPVAMIVVTATGWVTTEYVCGLDTTAGVAWLARRLEQARIALGEPTCRVPSRDASLVMQGSCS